MSVTSAYSESGAELTRTLLRFIDPRMGGSELNPATVHGGIEASRRNVQSACDPLLDTQRPRTSD
jgi:hypothetical protein